MVIWHTNITFEAKVGRRSDKSREKIHNSREEIAIFAEKYGNEK